MGVSGCGKTTLGKLLAEKKNLPFYDADDYHPISNLQKMKGGIPLSDKDRKPWLELLNTKLKEWSKGKGVVLACSALKESYRKLLTRGLKEVHWVFLSGTQELIALRMQKRINHFMPFELLRSQLAELEEPEYGIKVDIDKSPELIVEHILQEL